MARSEPEAAVCRPAAVNAAVAGVPTSAPPQAQTIAPDGTVDEVVVPVKGPKVPPLTPAEPGDMAKVETTAGETAVPFSVAP